MGITIKKIGDGMPYHIRFKKTQVFRRVFGHEERMIDEYYYEQGDEEYSEVIWMVPASRGLMTWFNFNKVERLEQLGVIDYHKNIFMGDFEFHHQAGSEYVSSKAEDGQPVHLVIQRNSQGYMADVVITYSDWYFRVHLEEPTTGIFDDCNNHVGKSTVDLTDFKFLSDNHDRRERDGASRNSGLENAMRGIHIKSTDDKAFLVSIHNLSGKHPVWGNNIQMSAKRMVIEEDSEDRIVLRGVGSDVNGSSHSDYGMTLSKNGNQVELATLHLHDRGIDMVYHKLDNEKNLDKERDSLEFEEFKEFAIRWRNSMPYDEKIKIAGQSDFFTNQGVQLYNQGKIEKAVLCFEDALRLMPCNDDVLKNLLICYRRLGYSGKIVEMQARLDFLSALQNK